MDEMHLEGSRCGLLGRGSLGEWKELINGENGHSLGGACFLGFDAEVIERRWAVGGRGKKKDGRRGCGAGGGERDGRTG